MNRPAEPHPLLRLLAAAAWLAVALTLHAGSWRVVDSDLPPHGGLQFGTLPNGLRYAVMRNSEPRGRVSLRLLVHVGSVDEHDDERGLAHFVEHMVFRGTRRHPHGALTEEMQRRGIGWGPDSTAFTSYEHTIYHIELPDATEPTLRFGLGVFREYAEEVSFDRDSIERERGVILSEKQTRDTPDYRVSLANLTFLFPNSRQVARSPIGLEEQIRRFTRAQFTAFYDAWYRPDRMAVVVVGDVAPDLAARLVTEVFASLRPRGAPREEPPLVPATAGNPNVKIFTDDGVVGASCWMEHPFPEARGPDTHARRVERLHRSLAFAMFQRRMTRLANSASGEFVAPFAQIQNPLPDWSVASFGVSGRVADWKSFVATLEREHRRAFVHGFTETELQLAKTNFTSAMDSAVHTATTWPSSWIATAVAQSMLEGTLFSAPAILRQDLSAALDATTTADCLAAFRAAWSTKMPHVFVTANPAFPIYPATIGDALNFSRGTPVEPLPEPKLAEFGYTDFGPAGTPAHEDHVEDLDIHQSEYANHVRLNFKATAFEADTVNLAIRIGDGRVSQPEAQPGLDLLAQALLLRGGLGKHHWDELEDLLDAHGIQIGFMIEDDAVTLTGRCPPDQVKLCLQVLTAYVTDAAFRDEATHEARGSLGSMYASLASAPSGPIVMTSRRILARGDRRFGLALPGEIDARTSAEVQAWLRPQFQHGPIELGVAGDTTWESVSTAVAQTLGALPARPLPPNRTDPTVRPPDAPTKPSYVYTTAPQLEQVALAWFCPVPALADTHQERRCYLLAAVIAERLRLRIREELGAAYGCSADFVHSDTFPALSYFAVETAVSGPHAQRANVLIRETLESLHKKHISPDEFARVLAPFVRQREDDRRDNRYWLYTVLHDAQQRPSRLVDARDRVPDTAAIKREELEGLAHRLFATPRWFQFVAYPQVRSALSFPSRTGN